MIHHLHLKEEGDIVEKLEELKVIVEKLEEQENT